MPGINIIENSLSGCNRDARVPIKLFPLSVLQASKRSTSNPFVAFALDEAAISKIKPRSMESLLERSLPIRSEYFILAIVCPTPAEKYATSRAHQHGYCANRPRR